MAGGAASGLGARSGPSLGWAPGAQPVLECVGADCCSPLACSRAAAPPTDHRGACVCLPAQEEGAAPDRGCASLPGGALPLRSLAAGPVAAWPAPLCLASPHVHTPPAAVPAAAAAAATKPLPSHPPAGILLNSQFSSNYFSISQVEQNFDDFAQEFKGGWAWGGGVLGSGRWRLRSAAGGAERAVSEVATERGGDRSRPAGGRIWMASACRIAHIRYASLAHPGLPRLCRAGQAAGLRLLLAVQQDQGLWVQGGQRDSRAAHGDIQLELRQPVLPAGMRNVRNGALGFSSMQQDAACTEGTHRQQTDAQRTKVGGTCLPTCPHHAGPGRLLRGLAPRASCRDGPVSRNM